MQPAPLASPIFFVKKVQVCRAGNFHVAAFMHARCIDTCHLLRNVNLPAIFAKPVRVTATEATLLKRISIANLAELIRLV